LTDVFEYEKILSRCKWCQLRVELSYKEFFQVLKGVKSCTLTFRGSGENTGLMIVRNYFGTSGICLGKQS